MAEYRIIQENGHNSIDIVQANSLKELVEQAEEMGGLQ